LELITPRDIVYVIALIINGKGISDQDDRIAANPRGGCKKKYVHYYYSKVAKV
jgi:hypothetical protein